eukprot:gene32550-40162_t
MKTCCQSPDWRENTVRPASRAREELVPSRYALQVGEIDVLVVSAGSCSAGSPSVA